MKKKEKTCKSKAWEGVFLTKLWANIGEAAPGKAIDQVLAILPATFFHGFLEELYHL